MYQINFDKKIKVHFIGIGGISMSGLAEILIAKGFKISGSDRTKSELTETLQKLGAEIMIGQRAENITDPDVVVYTAAISQTDPELCEARRKNIPVLTRAELLGEIMGNYREAVNISGTHGKTTTTSMLSEILLLTKKDPTITVGGMLDSIGGNLRVGGSEVFVAEACEYTNSFLSFYPTLSVVLNIEADHLDFFKDIDDIRHSFREFILRLPQNDKGFLVINGDIDNVSYFTDGLSCSFVTFGKKDGCTYTAKNICYDEKGCAEFDIIKESEKKCHVHLSVPGEHNVWNAVAAAAAAERLMIPAELIAEGLSGFKGTKRRLEYRGTVNGVRILDDYAHHPQEITASLSAAARLPHKKLTVIFQPHTYTRTKLLLNDFANALKAADEVVLADIYAAREKNTVGISSKDLMELINCIGGNAKYFPDFEQIKTYVLSTLSDGDLLITMGAGNVVDIANDLTGE